MKWDDPDFEMPAHLVDIEELAFQLWCECQQSMNKAKAARYNELAYAYNLRVKFNCLKYIQ